MFYTEINVMKLQFFWYKIYLKRLSIKEMAGYVLFISWSIFICKGIYTFGLGQRFAKTDVTPP